MAGGTLVMYAGCALGCAAVAATTDLRARRIPNWLTGPGFLLGVGLHLLLGGWTQAGLAVLAGLIAGSLFLLFYLAGGMGAGDVKLMAAIGALGGIALVRMEMFCAVSVGAVCAVVFAALRGRLRSTLRNVITLVTHHQTHGLVAHERLNVRNSSTLRLAYAAPIAGGCLLTLLVEIYGRAA